jgi:hypothetical protein
MFHYIIFIVSIFKKKKIVKTLVSYKFKKIIKNTLKSVAKSNQLHSQVLFIRIMFCIIFFFNFTIDQPNFSFSFNFIL